MVSHTSLLDVCRDLNVAVTRARHELIFVGDCDWLDQHPGGGLGLLWAALRKMAVVVPPNVS